MRAPAQGSSKQIATSPFPESLPLLLLFCLMDSAPEGASWMGATCLEFRLVNTHGLAGHPPP